MNPNFAENFARVWDQFSGYWGAFWGGTSTWIIYGWPVLLALAGFVYLVVAFNYMMDHGRWPWRKKTASKEEDVPF